MIEANGGLLNFQKSFYTSRYSALIVLDFFPLRTSASSAVKLMIYASLTVIDGQRILKPAQVGYDSLIFDLPPHLESKQIEIILRNGDAEQRSFATVLPHDQDATRIPIQLASTK